jgi:aminopeptidase N
MTSLRQNPLLQKNAELRFSHFAKDPNISYDLFLKFHRGDTYQGQITSTFSLQKTSSDLFIDYSGSDITSLTVNGASISNPESIRKDRFLSLPESNLKIGENTVTIGFKNKFATNGQGLHGFIDTDGKQYFYSELEPYNCNKFFPCFDQPDLKAPLHLSTAAPKEWLVVANNNINSELTQKFDKKAYLTTQEIDSHTVQVYNPTPKISSYLYCCCGGDYRVIKSEDPDSKYPMSAFCRESLVNYFESQAKEIFLIHKESIRFYEDFFGVAYPFEKCDILFAVEYNMGAMENPGLILYNDRYIWKD